MIEKALHGVRAVVFDAVGTVILPEPPAAVVYAATGQRTRALRQMEVCREALARHLGVEPEPETVAMYRELTAGA